MMATNAREFLELTTRVRLLERKVDTRPVTAPARQPRTALLLDITQVGHGFEVGQVIGRRLPLSPSDPWGEWELALSSAGTFFDDYDWFEDLGVVSQVIDDDRLVVCQQGECDITGGTYDPGEVYWLSDAAGVATATYPGRDTAGTQTYRAVFRAITATRIYVFTPLAQHGHNHWLRELHDVSVADIAEDQILTYRGASAPVPFGFRDVVDVLGSGSQLSVFGVIGAAPAARADIVATTIGQVLQVGTGPALVWATIGSASIAAGAVTAAKIGTDVVLDTLNDVTITSVADLNFLRYDLATTQWKNVSLGPIAYTTTGPTLALDGGISGPGSIIVGLGGNHSRFVLGLGSSAAQNTKFDITLVGNAATGGEKVARIRSSSSAAVSFYDQASGTANGTEVLQWACSATASSRGFNFLTNVDFATSASQRVTFSSSGVNIGGFSSSGSTLALTTASGVSLELSYNNTVRMRVTSTGTDIALNGNLAFFGAVGTAKVTVAAPSAITVSGTAGGTYTATEQGMINALKTDVTNLRSTLAALQSAISGYGQV